MSIPVCPGCGAVAERGRDGDRVWWETEHEPDCPWLADPDSEPYS